MIWTKKFWMGAGERCIKTFFQSGIVLVGTSAVLVQQVEWPVVASGAGLAAILSLATSIGSADFTAGDDTEAKHL